MHLCSQSCCHSWSHTTSGFWLKQAVDILLRRWWQGMFEVESLFGRQLKPFNPDPFQISYSRTDLNVHSRKINNILNHFWDRWKKEYLINLREHHKVKLQKFNRPQMQLKDNVMVEEERQSRSMWRVGIVEELFQGNDSQIWRAKVRIPKTNSILKRPVNKLYLVKRMKDTVTEVDIEVIKITDGRSRREVAILGEIKRTFNTRHALTLFLGRECLESDIYRKSMFLC